MKSRTLLHQWLNGIHIDQIAHLRCAARFHANHRLLGVPVTALTAVVGTTLFATLESSDKQAILIVAGMLSALAAVLSALQTFLNYADLASRHAEAGKGFGRLRKRVEELLATAESDAQLGAGMAAIRTEWDQLQEQSPTVPQTFHERARRLVLGAPAPAGTGDSRIANGGG